MRQMPRADSVRRGLYSAGPSVHFFVSGSFLRKPRSAAKTKEGHAIAKTMSGRKSNHVCQLFIPPLAQPQRQKYAATRKDSAYFFGFGAKEA
jgi:hypothetical protein